MSEESGTVDLCRLEREADSVCESGSAGEAGSDSAAVVLVMERGWRLKWL